MIVVKCGLEKVGFSRRSPACLRETKVALFLGVVAIRTSGRPVADVTSHQIDYKRSMAKPLKDRLNARARKDGFDRIAVCKASLDGVTGARLKDFVAMGRHGDMAWMQDTLERRMSPDAMWPNARTAIVVALNYGPELDPLKRLEDRSAGVVSVYALNRDYHEIIKGRLKQLAGWLAGQTGAEVKVFVDTAPLMEKPLAHQAGLGWQGKHTNLVSREFGSWLFLGVILTTAQIEADLPETDHCGQCRACLDICPTDAFPAPYQLDARRCISYLTIEHKGHIPEEFRKPMGNRIFGCDDCLAVCPWNKFAKTSREAKLMARQDLAGPTLHDLIALEEAEFRKLFAGSPVRRAGYLRFLRNVLIAIGNSGDIGLSDCIRKYLLHPSPLVRAMAVWALHELLPRRLFEDTRDAHMASEHDQDVLKEWQRA